MKFNANFYYIIRNIILVACFFTTTSNAECVRLKPDLKPKNTAPDYDGPGSFGELHNTVTLGCLKYVGSIKRKGQEHVLIKDDKGKIHLLKLGSYMGENGGIIKKIDRDSIYIEQIIYKNGNWKAIVVVFPKKK